MTDAERFFAKVQKTDTCWLWHGAKNSRGYGNFLFQQRTEGAHRWSYRFHVGDIADRMEVCHTCDNPSCVRPDHLFVGTSSDNKRDAVAKGRLRGLYGVDNRPPNVKLDPTKVSQIRLLIAEGLAFVNIARLFDISPTAVKLIASGRTWRHV